MGRGAAARKAGEGGLSDENRKGLGVKPGGDPYDAATAGLKGNQYAHILIDLSTGRVMIGRWPGKAAQWSQLWEKYGGAGKYSNAYTAAIECRRVGGKNIFTLVNIARGQAEVTMSSAIRGRILTYLRRSGARGTFQWFENGKLRSARIT